MPKNIIRKISTILALAFTTSAYAGFTYGPDFNSANMSYTANSTLSQYIVLDSTQQSASTFDFSVQVRNGGGRPTIAPSGYTAPTTLYSTQTDSASVTLKFYDSSNNLIATQTSPSVTLHNYGTASNPGWSSGPGDNIYDWTTLSYSVSSSTVNFSSVHHVQVILTGTDGAWWAGDYGVQWRAPTLVVDGSTTNILYNPQFGIATGGVQAQGWTSSTGYASSCGVTSGSATCVTNGGAVANGSSSLYDANGGTTSGTSGGYASTFTNSTFTGSAGSGTVTNTATISGPTIVSTAAGTPTVTSSSSNGTSVTTSVTNTTTSSGTDANGNPTVTTYYTVTTTTTTPQTTTTVTTPVTVTTWSDGTTTTTNGTPVTTTSTTNIVTTSTTSPAVQSVATTEDVVTATTTTGTTTDVVTVTDLPSSSVSTTTLSSASNGNNKDITRDITTVTNNPTNTNTVSTTPVTTVTTITPTTTTVDGSGNVLSVTTSTPTVTSSTVYNTTSVDLAEDHYSTTDDIQVKSVNVGGISSATNMAIVKPYIVDPLSTPDGSWTDYSMYSGNNVGTNGLTFGYQRSAEGNTVGISSKVGRISSSGLENSTVDGDTYAGNVYVLTRQSPVWLGGSIGFGLNNYTVNSSIVPFDLSYSQKSRQTTAYVDITAYSPETYSGWRPFGGVTIVRSDIGNVTESGSFLLSNNLEATSKTYTMPYVGAQNEIAKGVTIETRVTQTEQYGTIVTGKLVAKTKLTDSVTLKASVGADKGQNYDGISAMLGLVVNF